MNDITIYINNECNLDCNYCNVEKSDISLIWDHRIEKIILDVIRKPGERKRIGIMGGEPLMNWDFIDKLIDYINLIKVEYLDKKIYITAIPTNGTIYRKEMYQKLEKNGIELKFSIDTFFDRIDTNRIHTKVKNYHLYKIISENIMKYRSIYGKSPRVGITIGKDNVTEIEKLIYYLIEKWGIKSFYFCFIFGQKYEKSFLKNFEKEYIKIFQLYVKYIKKGVEIMPIEDIIVGILKKQELSKINCCGLWKEIIVSYNGYIYSCDWIAGKGKIDQDYIIGDIEKGINWGKMWEGLKNNIDRYKNKSDFREKLQTKKMLCLNEGVESKEDQEISYSIYETMYKIPHLLLKDLPSFAIYYIKNKYDL